MRNFGKKTIIVFTSILFTSNISCAPNQDEAGKKMKMIREFYTAYISEVSGSQSPKIMAENLEELQSKYCTKRLIEELPEIIESTEADPFLKSQDGNLEWLNSLSVWQNEDNINQYYVSFIDTLSKSKVIVKLTITEEDGSYKIDSII